MQSLLLSWKYVLQYILLSDNIESYCASRQDQPFEIRKSQHLHMLGS